MLKKRIKNYLHYLFYQYLVKSNKLIKSQRTNPLSIPIIIINFNQLFYLKQLVDFLLKRGFENIVIIDNLSTYPPLLEYYKTIKPKVKVEYMSKNFGHKVFFESEMLQKKYGKGYYVLTDSDIVPNINLPNDFMTILLQYLDMYFRVVNKVGFALKIDDIPNEFPLKDKVIKWEQQFWNFNLSENIYKADIDTTLALYKPSFPTFFNNIDFYRGVRIAGNFEAKHGGWYKDVNNLTDEEKYYILTASSVSSWNVDFDGNHKSTEYDEYI